MSFFRIIITFLFPLICVACEQYGNYFCNTCQNKIDFLYFKPKLPPLVGVVSDVSILGFFAPPLSTVIKALKYESLWPIGAILGNLLYKHLMLPNKIDIVTAVPLHPKRWRERGYNQAELIARQLAKRLNKPCEQLLIRQHHSQNLASTKSDEERLALIQDAFTVNPHWKEKLKGKNVLLLDDVITTGATVFACSRALRKCQIDRIIVAAVAHGG